MLFNKEIVGLHDDGFEGSIDEHQIFTEVFFGNDHDKTSKKCLVTGVINFECDKSKQTDGLLSPHSETSAITSQLDSSSVNCLKENSGPGCFSNGHALLARNDVIGNGKRIKLSVGEQSVFHSVTCHLVESSSHGITSSCYLLKGDVFKHRLASFNANDEKEICASKATPSPISQECSANKSRSLKSGGERIKKSKIDKLSGDQTLSNRDSMKDPRPLLRKYIQNLLRAKGWEIVRRIREDKVNGAFIYVSPQGGRRIHEFRRAWNLCGQSFSIDRTLVVLEDGKQWNDMAAFLSDLTNTLRKIDKELLDVETSSSLALQWCLLDPFVNLVFIDKKLGMLKVGEVVKARSSLLLDSYVKDDTILFLKDRDRIANQSQRGLPHGVCESSLIGGNVLMNTEANYGVCDDRCGTRITVDLGQLSRGTVKALNGVPVYLCEEKCTLSGITDGLNANSLQACELDGNSDHSSSCLLEVPIISQNGNFVFGDNVSTPQDEEHSRFRNFVSPSHSSGEFNQFSHHCEQSKEFNFESEADAAPISLDPEFLRQDINSETPESQSGNVQKRPAACPIKDDDLLISAVIKNKTFRSTARKSIRNTKPYRSKPPRKRKTQKGSCRLLPRSLGKGGKHVEGKWFVFGSRTVLSWLISSGVVSLNEVIQYRNLKDDAVVKEGLISRDGILCKCCSKVLSISKFKFHAGFRLNRSCLNLVMGSGKLFALCQLEAWSDEYKARKSATKTVQDEEMDQNDDSCGLCGDGGELICCDNCPSTFHQTCLCEKELPVGSWYCQHCTCRICGDLVNDKGALESTGALKCSQCDHKYHEACLKGRGAYREVAYEAWFCDESCREVYIGLQSQVGRLNLLSDGFSWTLLRCIHGDQRVHSAQRFVALKAECNSKLAVALTIMEECFLSMVDARTGIDMIPHVLYNWGSEFARLNYEGFYTLVLEKDDVLISAASIRIHGVTVAEMPLIATCSKYRRQGMCRRLMNSIEEMLKSFKVEKLVITAIPSLVETWTVGFGFEPLEDHERKGLSNINLMVFPGTVWLKKPMYKIQATDEQKRPDHAAPLSKDDGAVTGPCSDGVPILDFARQLNGSMSLEVVANETENGNTDGIMRMEREDALHEKGSNGLIVDFARQSSGSFSFVEAANETKNGHTNGTGQTLREDGLHEDFSSLSCEEPVLTEGQTHETVRQVEAVVIYDERGLSERPCLDSIARLGKDKVAMASHVDSVVMYDARELPEMSCEAQPTSKLEEQFEMASHDSVVKYNERKVSSDEQLQEANILLDNER